jgi:hypothetical protein
MANSKISALASASTPLAGTETLPIVQSGATVKIPTNDLTVRNIRAAATTGILQVSGPTAGTTRTATVPDANWTAARTDAAQSFTGDQTLSTGNLVVSNGKGIDFSATAGTGTSELLSDYEEGTWTPTFNFWSTAPTSVGALYTKTGRQVTINLIALGGVSIGSNTQIAGLPFASNSLNGASCVLSAISATNENSTGNISDNSLLINYIASVNFSAIYWCMSITYIF